MRTFFSVATLFGCLTIITEAVPQGRISGGNIAKKGQFPYQVSLIRNGVHGCGGSIISRNYILTAAHCVGIEDKNDVYHTYSPKNITVLVGAVNRVTEGTKVRVAAIKAHKNYSEIFNDIALLKLAKPLKFSKLIQPIPLIDHRMQDNESVVVTGWGDLETNGETSNNLRWAVLKSLSRRDCALRTKGLITFGSILCLSHSRHIRLCQGDSGGPAVANGVLVGVATFVISECGSGNPDGYTRVLPHLRWIKMNSDVKP